MWAPNKLVLTLWPAGELLVVSFEALALVIGQQCLAAGITSFCCVSISTHSCSCRTSQNKAVTTPHCGTCEALHTRCATPKVVLGEPECWKSIIVAGMIISVPECCCVLPTPVQCAASCQALLQPVVHSSTTLVHHPPQPYPSCPALSHTETQVKPIRCSITSAPCAFPATTKLVTIELTKSSASLLLLLAASTASHTTTGRECDLFKPQLRQLETCGLRSSCIVQIANSSRCRRRSNLFGVIG